MYRILIARSGNYYVQQKHNYDWRKVGGFFNTRSGAKRFIDDHRDSAYHPRVVAYY